MLLLESPATPDASAGTPDGGGPPNTRPDIHVVIPGRGPAPAQHLIVEVKTCVDTRYTDQLANAMSQHAALADALRTGEPGTQVRVIPILAGVGGSIYREHTLKALEGLGVSPDRAAAACARIHRIMVQHLHAVVVARRQLEQTQANTHKNPGRPP